MCRCVRREGVGCRQMVDMIAGPGHVPAAWCGEDLGRAGVAGITIQPLSLIICTLFCNLHWGSGIRWISPPDNLSLQPRLAQMNTKQQLSSPLLSTVQTCKQCLKIFRIDNGEYKCHRRHPLLCIVMLDLWCLTHQPTWFKENSGRDYLFKCQIAILNAVVGNGPVSSNTAYMSGCVAWHRAAARSLIFIKAVTHISE